MYIKARVTPGAKKETFSQESKDHFVISVKEEAERNMANRRIIELLSRHYGIPAGKVRIVNGHHSGSKILSIEGIE